MVFRSAPSYAANQSPPISSPSPPPDGGTALSKAPQPPAAAAPLRDHRSPRGSAGKAAKVRPNTAGTARDVSATKALHTVVAYRRASAAKAELAKRSRGAAASAMFRGGRGQNRSKNAKRVAETRTRIRQNQAKAQHKVMVLHESNRAVPAQVNASAAPPRAWETMSSGVAVCFANSCKTKQWCNCHGWWPESEAKNMQAHANEKMRTQDFAGAVKGHTKALALAQAAQDSELTESIEIDLRQSQVAEAERVAEAEYQRQRATTLATAQAKLQDGDKLMSTQNFRGARDAYAVGVDSAYMAGDDDALKLQLALAHSTVLTSPGLLREISQKEAHAGPLGKRLMKMGAQVGRLTVSIALGGVHELEEQDDPKMFASDPTEASS